MSHPPLIKALLDGSGEVTSAEQQSARARDKIRAQCVVGNDECREVICRSMYFGGSSQGRKQPFPPLFFGAKEVLSVACEHKGYFQEVSLCFFNTFIPTITVINETSAAVCVLCYFLRNNTALLMIVR